MNPENARDLCLLEMDKHGLILRGWQFRWSKRRRVCGQCDQRNRIIELSKPWVLVNDWEPHILDTVRHEIAHALVGPGHGHGPIWRACAERIGASPCRSESLSNPAPGKYQAICPGCGHIYHSYARKRGQFSCSPCAFKVFGRRMYSERFFLDYRRVKVD